MATKTPAAPADTVPNPRKGRVSVRYYVVAGGNEVDSATVKPQAVKAFNLAKKAHPGQHIQLKHGDKVIDEHNKPDTIDIPGLGPQPTAGIKALAAGAAPLTEEELDAKAAKLTAQIQAAPAGPKTEAGKLLKEMADANAAAKKAGKKTTSAGIAKAPKAPTADKAAALAKAADPKLIAKRDHDRPVANAAVREWAAKQGHTFSATGHVRKHSIDAFLLAHPGAGVTGNAKIVLPGDPDWQAAE